MASKFDLIIESALRRYQGVNFLIGDRVKLKDDYTNHDWWKSQPALKIERIKGLIESGDNIRVSAVKAIRPATADSGHFQDVDGFYVDIVREAAPGLMMSNEIYTLPDFLLELQDDGINLAGETTVHFSMLIPLGIMLFGFLLYTALIFLMKYRIETIRVKKKGLKKL